MDDAVGEAYDKVARTVGLGYPGGPQVDKLAAIGKTNYRMPDISMGDTYNFSFSGIKSHVINLVHNINQRNEVLNVEDLCASFQEAVADVLVSKSIRAIREYDAKMFMIAGGVAANKGLRKKIDEGTAKTPEEDEDNKTKKKLRDISDLTNKIKIENLERAIKYNEEEIEAEKTLYGDKVILADSNAQMQMRIQDLVLEDKIKRIENGFAKEIKETAKGSERAKALENEKNQKIELARAEHKTKLLDIEFKTANEIDKIQKEELKRFDEQFKDKEQQLENQKNIELKILRETAKTKKELDEGTKEINKKYFELQKQQLIELVQTWIEYANSIGLATKGLEDLLAKLKSESFAPDLDKVEVQMEDWIQLIGQAINEIGNLADALFERRIEQINAEIEKEKELYETKIKLAGDDVKEKESLEQQRDAKLRILEKKKLREEQKQARVRKAAALVQIGVSTALAVMKNVEIYGFGLGSAFNILTIALGAIQAATVLAQPIPQYKDGLDSAKTDHIGMINDGGKQEFLERNGELFTSTQKNMLVPLKVGDTIYKDFDDMKKNSILMSAIGNGNQFSQSNYNALSMAITGSIDKGLKKVKFNNNIRLVDNRQNNNYQQSLSKWN